MTKPLSIDLFCHVVDNFGDIGVCWRLARQLAEPEHGGARVRLFVDDFKVFARIERDLDAQAARQVLRGVEIFRWDGATVASVFADGVCGDAVIEAFACDLPGVVIAAMKAREIAPVWLDLEYLSAEDWVDGVHAIPSHHPETGLQKTLFFPGFTPATGGLSREAGLIRARDDFQFDPAAQAAWRAAQGIPPAEDGVLDISLFCYDNAPLESLVAALCAHNIRARLLIPAGVAVPQQARLSTITTTTGGSVTLHTIPFLRQEDYDRLLWACGLNFVRGEDSFVRALWAGRPFIWQIYVQEDDAHLVKLGAFLQRYSRNLDPFDAETLAQFTVMWNQGGHEEGADGTVTAFLAALPRLTPHALMRADDWAGQPDLATQLVCFIRAHTPQ